MFEWSVHHLHYIYKFQSIFLTNVYKTSINTTSPQMDFTDTPAPILPITPRRSIVLTLVSEVNGVSDNAKIDSLLMEVEKFSSKVGVVVAEIEKVSVIMKAVGEADALAVVTAMAPLSSEVTHTLMMIKYDEMHLAIASEQSKMRVHITNLAIAMTLFILLMFFVVLVVVYVTVDYIPPVGQCPAAALPTVWDDTMCCTRMFAK